MGNQQVKPSRHTTEEVVVDRRKLLARVRKHLCRLASETPSQWCPQDDDPQYTAGESLFTAAMAAELQSAVYPFLFAEVQSPTSKGGSKRKGHTKLPKPNQQCELGTDVPAEWTKRVGTWRRYVGASLWSGHMTRADAPTSLHEAQSQRPPVVAYEVDEVGGTTLVVAVGGGGTDGSYPAAGMLQDELSFLQERNVVDRQSEDIVGSMHPLDVFAVSQLVRSMNDLLFSVGAGESGYKYQAVVFTGYGRGGTLAAAMWARVGSRFANEGSENTTSLTSAAPSAVGTIWNPEYGRVQCVTFDAPWTLDIEMVQSISEGKVGPLQLRGLRHVYSSDAMAWFCGVSSRVVLCHSGGNRKPNEVEEECCGLVERGGVVHRVLQHVVSHSVVAEAGSDELGMSVWEEWTRAVELMLDRVEDASIVLAPMCCLGGVVDVVSMDQTASVDEDVSAVSRGDKSTSKPSSSLCVIKSEEAMERLKSLMQPTVEAMEASLNYEGLSRGMRQFTSVLSQKRSASSTAGIAGTIQTPDVTLEKPVRLLFCNKTGPLVLVLCGSGLGMISHVRCQFSVPLGLPPPDLSASRVWWYDPEISHEELSHTIWLPVYPLRRSNLQKSEVAIAVLAPGEATKHIIEKLRGVFQKWVSDGEPDKRGDKALVCLWCDSMFVCASPTSHGVCTGHVCTRSIPEEFDSLDDVLVSDYDVELREDVDEDESDRASSTAPSESQSTASVLRSGTGDSGGSGQYDIPEMVGVTGFTAEMQKRVSSIQDKWIDVSVQVLMEYCQRRGLLLSQPLTYCCSDSAKDAGCVGKSMLDLCVRVFEGVFLYQNLFLMNDPRDSMPRAVGLGEIDNERLRTRAQVFVDCVMLNVLGGMSASKTKCNQVIYCGDCLKMYAESNGLHRQQRRINFAHPLTSSLNVSFKGMIPRASGSFSMQDAVNRSRDSLAPWTHVEDGRLTADKMKSFLFALMESLAWSSVAEIGDFQLFVYSHKADQGRICRTNAWRSRAIHAGVSSFALAMYPLAILVGGGFTAVALQEKYAFWKMCRREGRNGCMNVEWIFKPSLCSAGIDFEYATAAKVAPLLPVITFRSGLGEHVASDYQVTSSVFSSASGSVLWSVFAGDSPRPFATASSAHSEVFLTEVWERLGLSSVHSVHELKSLYRSVRKAGNVHTERALGLFKERFSMVRGDTRAARIDSNVLPNLFHGLPLYTELRQTLSSSFLVGVVGHAGVGKSTFVSTIVGSDLITAGATFRDRTRIWKPFCISTGTDSTQCGADRAILIDFPGTEFVPVLRPGDDEQVDLDRLRRLSEVKYGLRTEADTTKEEEDERSGGPANIRGEFVSLQTEAFAKYMDILVVMVYTEGNAAGYRTMIELIPQWLSESASLREVLLCVHRVDEVVDGRDIMNHIEQIRQLMQRAVDIVKDASGKDDLCIEWNDLRDGVTIRWENGKSVTVVPTAAESLEVSPAKHETMKKLVAGEYAEQGGQCFNVWDQNDMYSWMRERIPSRYNAMESLCEMESWKNTDPVE